MGQLKFANGDIPNVQPPAKETGGRRNNYLQPSDETPPKLSEGGKLVDLTSHELAEKRAEYGLVYICYMRFMRRTEGVQKSRVVFKIAREDCWTPWEVYEAAGEIIVVNPFYY